MNVYGSQTSPVVLCMQYSVINTRSTCLYGSQCFFACKTATFGAELQLSMGPTPHLSFSACKRAWIASEILVSMGPCPHLWFLDAKQHLFDQNYKSLFLPVLTFALCMQNSVICISMTSLYGFQPSSCFFSRKSATLGPYLQVCIGPRPHPWFCTCKTATLRLELQLSVGPRPHMWFLHAKQRLLDQNNKSLWVPDMTCRFVHVQERA